MAIRYYKEGTDYLPAQRVKTSEWIRETIHNEGFRAGDIGYIFCSSEYHLDINKQYLGHDYHTDVITFDYSDLTDTKIVSGDIFIDPATVADNADLLHTDVEEEQRRVVIHGIIHLCGYEDKTDAESKVMREKENFYLSRFPK